MLQRDLELVLAWRNHIDIRKYMYSQHKISHAEHEQWFEKSQRDIHRHLLIFEIDDVPKGFISLATDSNKVADWGFYAAPGVPKGTGSRLGIAALNYAFTEVGLHKICGQALAFNTRSIKFHETLGFKLEGVLREQYFDGLTYSDVLCFGMLQYEWCRDNQEKNANK